MINISGKGFIVTLIATRTFPVGAILQNFADDTDPLDIPSVQIGDGASEVNGSLVFWNVSNPTKLTIAVLPGTLEAIILNTLFQVNRPRPGMPGFTDIITMNVRFPDLSSTTFNRGFLTAGTPGQGIQSSQRKKTKTYEFMFEEEVDLL